MLDIGTKGGIIFYGTLGIVLPFIAYGYMTGPLEYDIVTAGNIVLVAYVGLATVGWTASYVFRVANKDMTYAKQLKDYEQAVIQKRFDELSGDEVRECSKRAGYARGVRQVWHAWGVRPAHLS